MRVTVMGGGYVGLVTSLGLAHLGHRVTCVEPDADKRNRIAQKQAPFFESGIPEALHATPLTRFSVSATAETVAESDCVIVAVGTPSTKTGTMDDRFIRQAVGDIAERLRPEEKTVVAIKSTVLPGTTDGLESIFQEKKWVRGRDYFLCATPEFLREGQAWHDFFHPDRIVLGIDAPAAAAVLRKLHKGIPADVIETTPKTAEMVKYVSNSFLASKISFTNQVARLCEAMHVNVDEVFNAVGKDRRIGPAFFTAGTGFGGSCFPKDVRALAALASRHDVAMTGLEQTLVQNQDQPRYIVDWIETHVRLEGQRVGVLGIAFKPGTDDVRESRAIDLMQAFLERKSHVNAFDPQAAVPLPLRDAVHAKPSANQLVADSDIIVVATPWPEFTKELMRTSKPVFDPWRMLSKSETDAKKNYHAFAAGQE